MTTSPFSYSCLHFPSDNGQTARCTHPASTRLQGDVFHGRSLLDVQDSNSSLSNRCYHLPGLPARHSPRNTLRLSGFPGRFLRDPTFACLHLHHVQRGGHAETKWLDDNLSGGFERSEVDL